MKRIIGWLRDQLLYSGLSRRQYEELLPEIREENRRSLMMYSAIGTVLFFILAAASLIMRGVALLNKGSYILSMAIMAALYLGARSYLPKHGQIVTPFVYIFAVFLYAVSMLLSLLHGELPGVTVIVFVLAIPLFFHGRTINMIVSTVIVCAVFSMLAWLFKDPEIAYIDTWNVISFGILGVVLTTMLNRTKLRALAQAREIRYLSETDVLTGAKNRNCYETRLQTYPDRAGESITCVYADVNGLHETNNRAGHAAGDRMLQKVAEEIRARFGAEDTYRIGGDEFVFFRLDVPEEQTARDIREMKAHLEELGYYVSFGAATLGKGAGSMGGLIQEAESRMYLAKKAYYSQQERDRRSRS